MNLTIGHGASINVDCFFDCLATVTMGRGVMMGMGVTIVAEVRSAGPRVQAGVSASTSGGLDRAGGVVAVRCTP